MFNSEGTLKHLAFFEELAQLEESDTTWRAITAGLVVLRLVDAWVEEGPRVVTADAWGLRAVRSAIEEVTERSPVRAILNSIVDALEASPVSNLQSVAPRLMAYGQALEYDASMTLAADVYRTIIAYTHPIDDADVAILAHLRMGSCLRAADDIHGAAGAYETAGRVANAVGDIMGVLRARIGDAQIAVRRGNLPKAEEILDETIARAAAPELREVRSRALHDRSTVAHHRGQFDLAVQLAYDALGCSVSARERDRILGDIAGSFAELGVLTAARDAYLVLAATAQEQYVRWASALNLMDIAAREMAQPAFERYRRELECASLPPHMQANFELMAGQGYSRFGDSEEARNYLERARSLAETHGYGQLLFEAEKELAELQRAKRFAPEVSAAVPSDLIDVASRLRRMREVAVPG